MSPLERINRHLPTRPNLPILRVPPELGGYTRDDPDNSVRPPGSFSFKWAFLTNDGILPGGLGISPSFMLTASTPGTPYHYYHRGGANRASARKLPAVNFRPERPGGLQALDQEKLADLPGKPWQLPR